MNEGRSRNMRANRRSDTKPEVALRKALYGLGYRYRKDLRLDLPDGVRVRPDIVFTARKVAVFVDGCFWHGHPTRCRLPVGNRAYWLNKIDGNRKRDSVVTASLKSGGWDVVRIWEHELFRNVAIRSLNRILRRLKRSQVKNGAIKNQPRQRGGGGKARQHLLVIAGCVPAMALTELWKTAHKEIQEKHVQQVIGFAGDGKLRDGGVASREFRDFLAVVPSSFLSRYANDCLTDKFDAGGLALQDVINEVGTRLGFRVEKGRYRGTPGEIGFDGLWISPDGNAIIVEVKTTDAYRIDLGTVAAYRRNVIGSGPGQRNQLLDSDYCWA
jgi:DNA mismatch endonuclease (patch repair protein)